MSYLILISGWPTPFSTAKSKMVWKQFFTLLSWCWDKYSNTGVRNLQSLTHTPHTHTKVDFCRSFCICLQNFLLLIKSKYICDCFLKPSQGFIWLQHILHESWTIIHILNQILSYMFSNWFHHPILSCLIAYYKFTSSQMPRCGSMTPRTWEFLLGLLQSSSTFVSQSILRLRDPDLSELHS